MFIGRFLLIRNDRLKPNLLFESACNQLALQTGVAFDCGAGLLEVLPKPFLGRTDLDIFLYVFFA